MEQAAHSQLETRRGGKYCLAAILVVIALGCFLRFWNIGGESLWFDEGYSAWVSGLDAGRIVHVIRHDVSPPLYYLLLCGWRGGFGDSEASLRGMSALAGCISLVLISLTAWRITSSGIATLVATALFAFSVLQIQYAQEARSYGLASMLAVVAIYAMVRRMQSRAAWLALACLSLAAAVYLHNMMWFYVAAIDLAYLTMPGKPRVGRRFIEIALLNIVLILAYLPWVPSLLGQIRWLNNNFWASVPAGADLGQVLLAICGTKGMHLSAIMYRWPAAWIFAGIVTASICLALASRENRRWTISLLLVGLLPIFAVFVYAHLRQSFFVEKVFVASTLMLPLVAAIVVARWRMVGICLSVLILAASIVASWGYLRWEHKEDWRGAVAYVNGLPRESTLVVFVANEGQLLYDYYTHRAGAFAHQATGAPQGFFDIEPQKTIQRVMKPQDTAALSRLIEQSKPARVVLVLSHTQFSDPEMLTEKAVAASMRRDRETKFNWIDVVEYVR